MTVKRLIIFRSNSRSLLIGSWHRVLRAVAVQLKPGDPNADPVDKVTTVSRSVVSTNFGPLVEQNLLLLYKVRRILHKWWWNNTAWNMDMFKEKCSCRPYQRIRTNSELLAFWNQHWKWWQCRLCTRRRIHQHQSRCTISGCGRWGQQPEWSAR